MSLESIHAEVELKNAKNIELVWSVLTEFASYPDIIDEVTSIKILENTGGSSKLEWDISLDGAPINWIEKEVLDVKNGMVHFEALDGDFDVYRGRWIVKKTKNGITISIKLEYCIDIPVIEIAIGGILKEKLKAYVTSLISGLGQVLKNCGL